MTLENLLGLTLERIKPSPQQITRLLNAAKRNLADAEIPTLSNENKFDAAYKGIMQLAMLALHANGYRTLTSRPGHHQTAIQTLPQTLGLPIEEMIVLDALRKQRNLADYSGDLIPDSVVRECLISAHALLLKVEEWLLERKAED
ncbi:DNA-binding protein [Eoetvoesiella caeni]|uniref:DNA-binding protein n=1 Tax=Eoetvoesiella caeni TaxID=645616 RepID=A0A366HIJ4_9BURK|nr:DNA-binding protein [Eoetvoesiella caeni]MCI2807821.1 DNA-binding protein [Eoetvoesiella caeni]NYT54177.1 DNA-binding protein [Eoetvoesiella caeni]RBP41736.1 hypothetical protein DFR37_102115 [Eoetvoesiella caeni]